MAKLPQVKVRPLNRTTLGVQASFQKGYAFKSGWYTDVGQPIVKVSDFTDASVDPEGLVCISPEVAQNYVRYRLQTNDVVIQTVGSWPSNPASVVGKVIRVPHAVSGALLNQNAVKLSPSSSLDQQFLFYRLRCSDFKDYIVGTAQGAASQASITLESIRAFEFDLFDCAVQKQIASILSAYDDLIGNNTRRIKILEQMAQMLYREWFVNFRFPGHERIKPVRSKIGLIPDKWTVLKIGEVLRSHIGGGWGQDKTDDSHTVPAHVIRGTDIPAARMGDLKSCPLRYHKKSNADPRRLQDGDLVFEVSGGSKGQPVGRALLVHARLLSAFGGDAMCASFCKLLRHDPSKIGLGHLYAFLLDSYTNGLIEKYQVQSTGITNFKFGVFLEDAKIAVPPERVKLDFERICSPLTDSIVLLGRKNAVLRQTRDLLLPKLISGEIGLEELETETANQVS